MPTPSATADRRSYALYYRFGPWRLALRSSDPGVTLSGDAIAWAADGRPREVSLRDIAEVHLQSGSVGENTIASCRLTFRDGASLVIGSNNARGLQDDEHDRAYVAFVADLHARLAALTDTPIAFTAGFGAARYRFGKVVLVVAGLFFLVTPAVLLVVTGAWSMIWTLAAGAGLIWPLYRIVMANAPRTYDPRALPAELMPASPA